MNEQTIEMQPEAYVAGQGGGAVNSVNGYTGDVVLTTSDLENTSDYQTGSEVESAISQAIGEEVTARQAADNNLQTQIDGITASSDVTDIVGTYADLEDYDTSMLGDNDIIKVLQDESQNDETTYYRWSTTTQSFTLIGEEGPYYTKSAVDQLLNDKQDTLTEGANVQIQNNVISATDTTYADFTGTDGTAAGTAGLVPAPATTDAGKFLKADGTWDTAGGSSINVVQTTGTSTTDVMSQKAVTDTFFYNHDTGKIRIGNTGNIGSSGVSIGKSASQAFNSQSQITIGDGAKSTGSFSTAIGWYPTAGTSYSTAAIAIGTRATASNDGAVAIGALNGNGTGSVTTYTTASGTSAIAIGASASASRNYAVAIGNTANSATAYSIAIGRQSTAGSGNNDAAVAIGANSSATGKGSIALGRLSSASAQGEMNIGTSDTSYGYNTSNYRLISGVYDGQTDHDAANYGQLNSRIIGSLNAAPTTSTAAAVGALVATVESGTGHLYICTDDTGGSYTWQTLV